MNIAHFGSVIDISHTSLENFGASVLGEPNPGLRTITSGLLPGRLAVAASEFSGLSSDEDVYASFVEVPDMLKGREESKHGLYFGQLIVESDSDQELPTYVAVKPHGGDASIGLSGIMALENEWAANEHVSNLSTYERAYLPLGVWKNEAGTPQLLTLFDEGTQSFDNIFWAKGSEAKKITPERITKALNLSMYAMGILHGAGLTHGDAQIKNFGRDRQRVRFIDIERLDRLPQRNGKVPYSIDTRRAIDTDLNFFASSLTDRGQVEHDMAEIVAPIITDELVVEQALKGYLTGIRQGQMRSGNTLSKQLITTPQKLMKTFKFVVEHPEVNLVENE